MANYGVKQLVGASQTVINTAANVAAGNFSATTTPFQNNDATYPDCPLAYAVLFINDWAAAPVAGTIVELWGLIANSDGTNDDTGAPSGTASGGARYFGAWVIEAADAAQRRTIVIPLEGINNGMSVDFYYKNGTAQQATNTGTNSTVKIIPFTYGITV